MQMKQNPQEPRRNSRTITLYSSPNSLTVAVLVMVVRAEGYHQLGGFEDQSMSVILLIFCLLFGLELDPVFVQRLERKKR
jgi:hypothetical protein